jgi:hypothetical protein
MGSLDWLGYLSHTQVVESSNLSPSNNEVRRSLKNISYLSQLSISIDANVIVVIRRKIFVIFIDLSRAEE